MQPVQLVQLVQLLLQTKGSGEGSEEPTRIEWVSLHLASGHFHRRFCFFHRYYRCYYVKCDVTQGKEAAARTSAVEMVEERHLLPRLCRLVRRLRWRWYRWFQRWTNSHKKKINWNQAHGYVIIPSENKIFEMSSRVAFFFMFSSMNRFLVNRVSNRVDNVIWTNQYDWRCTNLIKETYWNLFVVQRENNYAIECTRIALY